MQPHQTTTAMNLALTAELVQHPLNLKPRVVSLPIALETFSSVVSLSVLVVLTVLLSVKSR
jgi:hypothetical protein